MIKKLENDLQEAERLIKDVLIRVEGIPRDKALLMDPIRKDLRHSAGVHDLPRQIEVVRQLVFSKKGSLEFGETLRRLLEEEMPSFFTTRNPLAGWALHLGSVLLKGEKINEIQEAIPPGLYEVQQTLARYTNHLARVAERRQDGVTVAQLMARLPKELREDKKIETPKKGEEGH